MSKLKVMTIVGTRPEIIKLSRVIAELEEHTEHVLVSTGQNYDYELNKIFFDELEIRQPDYFLEIASGSNVAEDIGRVIARIDPVLSTEKPDAVLFYGDTNSTLAAISVKRRQIPIFHMEAGNRCFDFRVPEEINRKILDHISDVNMTISEHARRYLLNEGISAERVFKVGTCLPEIYQYHEKQIQNSPCMETLSLNPQEYFMVSLHREDNVDSQENLRLVLASLNTIAEKYNKRVIFSTHPRTRQRLDRLQSEGAGLTLSPRVEFLKPFGLFSFIKLQQNAFCVLSDSGSITEDASILDFPAVMIRRMHERPEGMDVGTVIMAGLDTARIIQAIEIVTSTQQSGRGDIDRVPDYKYTCVSKKVVRIIHSYVDYINRKVWSKNESGALKFN